MNERPCLFATRLGRRVMIAGATGRTPLLSRVRAYQAMLLGLAKHLARCP
jgi:hypothetical protein